MKIHNGLLQRACDTPTREALHVAGQRFNFGELADRAVQTARGLRALGVEAGATLAALLPNGLPSVLLFHAAALCGARYLPLNTRLTAREVTDQLRIGGAGHLLHGAGTLAGIAAQAAARLPGLVALQPDELPADAPACAVNEAIDLDDTAAILFTSGTTGRAKAACLSHGNLFWSALASERRLGSHTQDRWLVCLPLFHVAGLAILVRSALFGAGVEVQDRFDPERVSRSLNEEGVTLLSLVPTMLQRLLDARGEGCAPPALRALLLGGAAAPPALVQRARRCGFPVRPTYGLTEAASQVATAGPEDADADPRSVGRPLFGTRVRIADGAGHSLAPGAEGEILVSGPNVMHGYLGDPEATRRALQRGWLHTGDIGVLDAGGRLRVLDRRRDLVVSGGENVYPAEVESVLAEHPDVIEVAVAGVADLDLGRRVAAWVVRKPGSRIRGEALRHFARERLAGYKVPVRVQFVDALPRNAGGKLQRDRLVDSDPEPAAG